MKKEFDYSAFISYQRKDEKIAIWLQNHLEHYSIPSALRKEFPNLPKRIKQVFRDKTDLGAGGLEGSLHEELERSSFLVVVCSPHSAKSDWVGKEIEHFKKCRGEDYIIPFIVNGIPHSNAMENESFHPAFNEFADEPIGINVKEIGKQQALIKVLAKILGLRFDILWRRHKRYILRKRINILISVLLLCLLGFSYWYYTKPLYRYYADYVDKWGMPEGVIELDRSSVKHRYRSYRFEYRRIPLGEPYAFSWRLSKIEYVNSAGIPQDYKDGVLNDRYPIVKLEYNSSLGSIKNIDFQNKVGKTLVRWKVSSKDGVKGTLIDFIGTNDIDASGYLGASSTMSHIPTDAINLQKSSIKRYVLERDSQGYIISKSYHSSNADDIELSKTTDVNGVYKIVFVNDSLGRVLSAKFYGINDSLQNRSNGVAIQCNRYDIWGNTCEIKYSNSYNKPTLSEDLYAKRITECDKWRNIIKEQYFGINGKLCYNNNNFSQVIYKFDDNGYPISLSYYDIHSKLCRHREGYAKLLIKCDSRGNQIENQFEDVSGKHCENINGIAKYYVEYNRWGNPTFMAYYGLNGRLTHNKEGFAGQNCQYDRFGNCIETDFFDVDWRACSNNDGIATIKTSYNERGYPKLYEIFNIKGEKTLCKNGFASIKYQFSDRGNPIEIAYFDVEDMPCMTNWGFHKIKKQYDVLGNLIQFQYYDIYGHLCLSNELFASCKRFPDSLGNIKQWIYYDVNGNPTKDIYGVCNYQWKYDEFGRIIQARFFDEKYNLVKNKNGIVGWNVKYDSRGNQIEYENIDSDGVNCSDSLGIARWTKAFDQRGNQLSFATYDAKNSLKNNSNGIALWKSVFNDRGLLLKTIYYNENGLPCLNTDVGYSCYETKYDKNMNQIEVCTYDNKGDLCIDPKSGFARWVAKYDDKGDKIEMLSYSDKDSLCVCNYGYARWIAKYDKKGNLEESHSYDTLGNIIYSQQNNINLKKETRKYDSHRFRYDTSDIVFGLFFLLVLLIVLWFWLKNFTSNNIKQNILCLMGVIALLGFDYLYLRRPLLHFGLISYALYNYTWVLLLITLFICIFSSIRLLYLMISKIVLIFKEPHCYRKSSIKESIGMLIVCSIAIVWLLFALYFIASEGWAIYSNPL